MNFSQYLELETTKFNPQYDTLYQERDIEFNRVGDSEKGHDVVWHMEDRDVNVEEKTRLSYYPDFLFEMVQDIDTPSWGWYHYCDAKYLVYGYADPKNDYQIHLVYLLYWDKFKSQYKSALSDLPVLVSKAGWGTTINRSILWEDILNKRLAKIIYGKVSTPSTGSCRACGATPALKDGLCDNCFFAEQGWAK